MNASKCYGSANLHGNNIKYKKGRSVSAIVFKCMGLIVTAFPPTNFKFLACHQNLSIRNDGGREAVL